MRLLSEVRQSDVGTVGGKAASLGELLAAGFRVPQGVVLPAGARDLTASDLQAHARAAVAHLGPGPFAVRSSGIAEDGAAHSYAGMYDSILDVSADDLADATRRCLAGVESERAVAYGRDSADRIAVIIQRMVRPVAAGVVLTADPVSGDREVCIVSAVRGLGERLVSGGASGDEWAVGRAGAAPRRQPERAIDKAVAERVASQARRIAAGRGSPQDIEWAIEGDGTLWVLQARPMTALPRSVSWDAPVPGAFSRALRFGEWISEPVTPLFESWLLTTMEHRLHACLLAWIGQHAPQPYHVVVNGWYFYSLNFLSAPALLRTFPSLVWRLARSPRRLGGLVPALLRYSAPVFEREWREDLLPRYRAAVAASEDAVDTVPTAQLPALIDGLADLAGEYFASLAALAGGAYKVEMRLAGFYRRHLAEALGGSHLPLLAGFAPPGEPGHHAVVSLDWWHAAPAASTGPASPAADHARIVSTRTAAEAAALDALASSPRHARGFQRLLRDAQYLAQVREEQVRDLTLAWPVLRRAVLRMGHELAQRGALADPQDVFFLTRGEVTAALARETPNPLDVADRRAAWEQDRMLVAPLVIGRFNPLLRKAFDSAPRMVGAVRSETALVAGSPASPGRATGPVRVIRSAAEFDRLQPGDVLVAPLTAPAWTPLFSRAVAVVTDVGSPAAHASIIAREYGIPAVVGCGDATARLTDGMQVTVDGTTGNVE